MRHFSKTVALLAASATLLAGMMLPVAANASEGERVYANDLGLTRLALVNLQRVNKLRASHRTPLSAEQIATAWNHDMNDHTSASDWAEAADAGNPLPPYRVNKDMMKWAQHRADMSRDNWDDANPHAQWNSGIPSWYDIDHIYAGPEALENGGDMYTDAEQAWASEANPDEPTSIRHGYGHYLTLVSSQADMAGVGISCNGRGRLSTCSQAIEIGNNTKTKQPTESVEEAIAEVDRQIAQQPERTFETAQVKRDIVLHEPDGISEERQTATIYRRGKSDELAKWSEASFPAYTVPNVADYTANPAVVPARTVKVNDPSEDVYVQVYYTKNKPSKPDDTHKGDSGKHDSGKPSNPHKDVHPSKPGNTGKPSNPVRPSDIAGANKLVAQNRNTLKDGTYVMRSDLGSGFVMDLAGASKRDGGNVQIYQANGTLAQEWVVSHDKDGFVSLKNRTSGKLLDLTSAIVRNSQNIDLYHSNNTRAQKWIAVKSGNGVVLHSAVNPKFVVDVSGGARRNSANVQLYQANNSKAQTWIPSQTPGQLAARNRGVLKNGTVVLKSALGKNLVMDVAGASRKNGGNVQLYAANGTRAQEWSVSHDHTGFVILKNSASGKVLDLSSAIVRNNRNVDQWASNNTLAQRWIAVKSGQGIVFHSVMNPDYVLDVAGGARRNHANVQLYRGNNTAAQKWTIGLTSAQRADRLAREYKDVLADNEYTVFSRVDDTRDYGLFHRLVLDLAGASKRDNANIQIYHKNGTNAQKWIVTHDRQGYVMLRNKASGKMLDLSAAIARNGRNIDQYHANGTRAQKWIAVSDAHGVSLHSAVNPDYVLDVKGAGRKNGTNVQLYRSNGSRAQAWDFTDKDGWTTVDSGFHHFTV